MKRNISALSVCPLSLCTLMIASGLAIGLYTTLSHEDSDSYGDRIEIGLAEVSPRGDAGGYAVPASGESVTITASPSTVASGGASTLTYSLSNPQGHGLGAFGCTIYDNEYNYYGGFGGAGPSGSISTGPLTQTKVFNYACNVEDYDPNTWFGANAVNSTTVTVSAATAVNGVCGSSTNSCTAGSFSDTGDTANDNLWNCTGSNGGSTASCSSAKVNGSCASTVNGCIAGSLSDTADTANDNLWSCIGSNNGSTASCSIPKTNGACGGSTNSCTSGNFSDTADTASTNNWSCTGSNNGTTASCSTPKTNGACGGSINSCTSGSFSDTPADTAVANNWSCIGNDGGTTASCSIPKTNGACGGSINSCTAGSFSDTADTTTANNWSCTGSNNGTTASCTVPKVNGSCSGTINGCTTGTFTDTADTSTANNWSCTGSSNGTTASCTVPKVNAVCGGSINSCSAGTFNDDPDTTNDNVWHCDGSNNGTNASCTYPKTNGSCGSTANSCTTGAFQDTADSGTHKLWNCTGSNNGTTAACSFAFLNCSLDGATVNHGSSRVFYTGTTGTCDATTQQSRTCNDGTFSGSNAYQYASCTISPPTLSLAGRSSSMAVGVLRTANDSFAAEPNETLSFTWSSTFVNSCEVNFGSSTALAGTISGVSVPNPGQSQNYTAQCIGMNGAVVSKLFTVVTRERKPVLISSAARVDIGDTITLSYQMNGNTSCTFTGKQVQNRTVTSNGTTEAIPITGQTTFTLACPGGSNSVTVFVSGSVQEQ